MMDIKICGPGCASCEKAEKVVREAVAAAGIEAAVEKVTDFADMARLGVLSTPAVVIDGEIKCVGRVPKKDEVIAWLK